MKWELSQNYCVFDSSPPSPTRSTDYTVQYQPDTWTRCVISELKPLWPTTVKLHPLLSLPFTPVPPLSVVISFICLSVRWHTHVHTHTCQALRCVGCFYRSPARCDLSALWYLSGIQSLGLCVNSWTLPGKKVLKEPSWEARTQRLVYLPHLALMRECYRTVSLPGNIVGGLPKPEHSLADGNTSDRDLVHMCVCVWVFCIHTPNSCFEMKQYVDCLEASIWPFLLSRADYGAKSLSS